MRIAFADHALPAFSRPLGRADPVLQVDEGADRTLGRGGRSTSFRRRSEHHSTTPPHQLDLRSSDTPSRRSDG